VSRFVKQLLAERGIAGGSIGIVPPIAVPPRWTDMRKEDPWQCLQDVRAEVRAELGFSGEDIVVGCVAVLREPKGHADLLRAIAPLCKANPRLHLFLSTSPLHREHKLRTVLWGWLGQALNDDELEGLGKVAAGLTGELGRSLAQLLTGEEVDALAARCQRLQATGTFPGPSGQMPAVPWPLF